MTGRETDRWDRAQVGEPTDAPVKEPKIDRWDPARPGGFVVECSKWLGIAFGVVATCLLVVAGVAAIAGAFLRTVIFVFGAASGLW